MKSAIARSKKSSLLAALVLGLLVATTAAATCRTFFERLDDGSMIGFTICCDASSCWVSWFHDFEK